MSSYLIVGAKFRPPAQGLLNALPTGTKLLARREASNAYDANAIMVLVRTQDFADTLDIEHTDKELAGFGSSYNALMAQPEWHLGYIPRVDAATLAPRMDAAQRTSLAGELTFGATGAPRITLTEEI